MKKIFFAAAVALFLSVPISVQAQCNSGPPLTVLPGSHSIDATIAIKVLHEVSNETGISDAALNISYDKGETQIEEIDGGYRVFISYDNGGGIVDIMESNF